MILITMEHSPPASTVSGFLDCCPSFLPLFGLCIDDTTIFIDMYHVYGTIVLYKIFSDVHGNNHNPKTGLSFFALSNKQHWFFSPAHTLKIISSRKLRHYEHT